MKNSTPVHALLALALSVFSIAASAQAYPEKPVVWLVGGAAGGAADLLARKIAEFVAPELGQPILIENLPGAGGTVAVNKVAKSPPTGYLLSVGNLGYIAAAPSLYANLPYDPVKDLEAVVRLPDTPLVVFVNSKSPFKTFAELMDFARKNPGKLNFADGGRGAGSNLMALFLASRTGIQITNISYKGNGPAMNDLLGGQVDVMIELPGVGAPHVTSGRLRALATTTKQAVPLFPGVPPIADTVPGFEGGLWFGLYAPKGTPRAALDKVESAYMTASGTAAFQQKMAEFGMLMPSESDVPGKALAAFTATEVVKYRETLRAAKIMPE